MFFLVVVFYQLFDVFGLALAEFSTLLHPIKPNDNDD